MALTGDKYKFVDIDLFDYRCGSSHTSSLHHLLRPSFQSCLPSWTVSSLTPAQQAHKMAVLFMCLWQSNHRVRRVALRLSSAAWAAAKSAWNSAFSIHNASADKAAQQEQPLKVTMVARGFSRECVRTLRCYVPPWRICNEIQIFV